MAKPPKRRIPGDTREQGKDRDRGKHPRSKSRPGFGPGGRLKPRPKR